ncbi:hypothetical protein [Cellulomonas timonensis]|uniref:hypothetical protein n=1 Tax=Cellulomonas timonensis TaxID=1689271 RepID=UPI000A60F88A|nr:hypothetical protein [Cellulomonas timonensis]
MTRTSILAELAVERGRQYAKHGNQAHLPDGTGGSQAQALAGMARSDCQTAAAAGAVTFAHILAEEVAEALAEDTAAELRAELVQVAAVAVQWIEAIDARPVNPDCKGGKHRSCAGDAWDETADTATRCACGCHEGGVR